MNAEIGSPDIYVKTNNLPEVTSSNLFSRYSSEPDPNGLASYVIFGDPSTDERKRRFAYIDLGDTFVHPLAYQTLVYLKKIIGSVIMGDGDFYIKNGNVTKVTAKNIPGPKDDVGTGPKWLKNHFNEINFYKPGISETVKDRINFIKTCKPEEIFITKWLVMPAFFRDVDITSTKKNEINMMYQSILSQASIIKTTAAMFKDQYIVTDSHKLIQNKIIEMFDYFMTFTAGTKAFMQLHVLGKGVDYSARMVISTPKINCEKPEDMEVSFSRSAVPLAMVIECFAPFIHFGFKDFINSRLNGSKFMYRKDSKGQFVRVQLADHWEDCLLKDNIQKLIKLYVDSKEHRLDQFTLEANDGSRIPIGYIDLSGAYISATDGIENVKCRPITLCELFYMIAYKYCGDQPIMVTRYPVEDYNNIYPSKMNIIPFNNTEKRTIDGITYPRFPVITDKDIANLENIGQKFTDTVHLFPTYLDALGADFDGDQISIQGVFTKNNGADEYVHSKINIINIGGGTMRTTKDVTAHTLYSLTKDADE